MVRGRLKRESNPTPGRRPGFTPQHDSTGSGDYVNTSPQNPLPVTDDSVEGRLQAIENKLDSVIENGAFKSQLTGSNVEQREAESLINRGVYNTNQANIRFNPPKWAKGFSLFLSIYAATGDFQNNEGLNVRLFTRRLNSSILQLETDKTRSVSRHQIIVYPDADLKDAKGYGDAKVLVSSIPVPNEIRLDVLINGTMGSGEGFDMAAGVDWLR